MGYLYYGNYALYYEVGRTEAIRELGLTYKQLEEMGIFMPVAELKINYYRPVRYDDLVTVKTMVKELSKSNRIQFHTELYNDMGQIMNKGVTTLVFFNPTTQASIEMPADLYERLYPYFQDKKA
ncbi:MAG: acyl-CoA thioesterase [Chitinophagia bacterium]|nr:acyl-CoA thioesterase [Chitinophagia bacterium]